MLDWGDLPPKVNKKREVLTWLTKNVFFDYILHGKLLDTPM